MRMSVSIVSKLEPHESNVTLDSPGLGTSRKKKRSPPGSVEPASSSSTLGAPAVLPRSDAPHAASPAHAAAAASESPAWRESARTQLSAHITETSYAPAASPAPSTTTR